MSKDPNNQNHHTNTKLVHIGRDTKASKGFVNPPLYKGSTVLFPTVKSLSEGGYGYWYGRKGSPTYETLENSLNELEGSDDTILTPSGLSAITTALLALLKTGDHLLVTDSVYQPTRNFCNSTLKALGIDVTYYDPRIGSGIEALIQ
ncbi:MAG: PLP-dependent transferase, partial [Rhizobiales bacterium]|nr:PLP-dependent transferase [Hyphomicrobiales bacterium]